MGARPDELRIGLVGAGVIAWAHALSVRALTRAGLVPASLHSVYDRDPDRARGFADALGLESVDSAAEVAAHCDVVYVCTSTAGHLEAVRAAASAGRAIFCEKPLGRNLAEADALVEAAADLPAQAGLVLRTAPVYRELARLVALSELGRPMAAVMRDDQYFPIQGHYGSTWRRDAAEAGSGALLEHSIHDVDVARMCFGEVASVSGTVSNFAGYAGIEDAASGVIRFEGGLSVSLVSVWHSVMSRPSTRRVEVMFEAGFVAFEDDFRGPLTVQTSDGLQTVTCAPPSYVEELPLPEGEIGLAVRPYVEENRAFLEAVAAGSPPMPSLEEALVAHRIVDAWYRSAEGSGGAIAGPFTSGRP